MRATPIALLAATAGSALGQDKDCADGLHMIVARGSDEDPGIGRIGAVAEMVEDKIDGSNVVGLDYPASLSDPSYKDSVQQGAKQLRDDVRDYIKKCPDSKLAVLGYSQGAQVVEDALCAGGAEGFHDDPPLPKDLIEDNVIAIVLFGDPARQEDAKYNAGTAKTYGIVDREDSSGCEAFAKRIISYCDEGDAYCDAFSGDTDRAIHKLYVERYGDDAADFVIDHWDNDTGDDVGDDDDDDDKDEDDKDDDDEDSTSTTAAAPSSTDDDSDSPTSTGSQTDDAEGGAATGTGEGDSGDSEDAGDAANGISPGLGFLAITTLGLTTFAVLGLM